MRNFVLFTFAIVAGQQHSSEILASSSPAIIGQRGQIQTRRFHQLQAFLAHYTGESFDERKIWFYGCNCLMQNDRAMSSPGKGKPVDKLDRHCMEWKICQRCVKETYGDQCIGMLNKRVKNAVLGFSQLQTYIVKSALLIGWKRNPGQRGGVLP